MSGMLPAVLELLINLRSNQVDCEGNFQNNTLVIVSQMLLCLYPFNISFEYRYVVARAWSMRIEFPTYAETKLH